MSNTVTTSLPAHLQARAAASTSRSPPRSKSAPSQWMAERAPRWLTSDQLTAARLRRADRRRRSPTPSPATTRYALLAVILCLVLNWFGDSMDGTLARVRHQQRPRYGFYVDHMVDVFGAIALMCGLAPLRPRCTGRSPSPC